MKKLIFDEYIVDAVNSPQMLKYKFVKKVIYGLQFDRYLTDEEKQANIKLAEIGGPQWFEHCNRMRKETADVNCKILEMLDGKFKIGQYKNDRTQLKDCDMWFWCNTNTATHDIGGRMLDFSYFTLSFERKENVKSILECLRDYAYDGQAKIKCTIVYIVEKDENRINKVCKAFADAEITMPMYTSTGKDKFYVCGDKEVRLYKREQGYAFKYKQARNYYALTNDKILQILFENNLIEKYLK